MKFVRLHFVGSKEPVTVNFDLVRSFYTGHERTGTHVIFSNDDMMCVAEKYDDIVEMLVDYEAMSK
jgi:hypothetical protein